LDTLRFYHRLAGASFYGILVCTAVGVIFQGLGIGLILPLLQGENSDNPIVQALQRGFLWFRIEFSITNILVAIMLLMLVRSVFMVAQDALVAHTVASLLVKLRYGIAEKIFALDYQASLRFSVGYFNNAITNEFTQVTLSFKMFCALVVNLLVSAAYMGMALYMNPMPLIFIGIAGLPLGCGMWWIHKRVHHNSIEVSRADAGLQGVLIQALNSFKYLKATSRYPAVLERVLVQSTLVSALRRHIGVLQAIFQHGFDPIVALLIAGTIYYYVVRQHHEMTELLFLLFLLQATVKQFLGAQISLNKFLACQGSLRVCQTLDRELAERKERTSGRHDFSFRNSCIQFEDVSFLFEDGTEVLKDIRLTIRPNTTIGIVGASGSGKTTLAGLIVGLLHPSRGSLRIGDLLSHDIHLFNWRRDVGYITQENTLFRDSLLNNLTLWQPPKNEEDWQRLHDATRKAEIDQFIATLPDGYHTELSDGGGNISGGQRQRLCIARELYKGANLLVFDEASSALDTHTERAIEENIQALRGACTIIQISHRLSTVRFCDEIIVLEAGRIVEQGTFDELVRKRGVFLRMLEQQDTLLRARSTDLLRE
jgi:subfamily B ATP-binding cassette protein MsbA